MIVDISKYQGTGKKEREKIDACCRIINFIARKYIIITVFFLTWFLISCFFIYIFS